MAKLSIGIPFEPAEKKLIFIGVQPAAAPAEDTQNVLALPFGALFYSAPTSTEAVLPGLVKVN